MNVYMDRTMPTNLDHKMLTGFTQEAQSYLPKIRAGIESFLHEAHQNEALEAAYQHVHTIKGASEMLELVVLSQASNCTVPGNEVTDGCRDGPTTTAAPGSACAAPSMANRPGPCDGGAGHMQSATTAAAPANTPARAMRDARITSQRP